MFVYLGTFIISFVFLWLAEKRNPKGIDYKLLILVALLIPILIAGMRKIGVGTDTQGYTDALYNAALKADNFINFLGQQVFYTYRYVSVTRWELGYTGMIYLVAKIFRSYQAVLLVTQALVIIPIFLGLRKFKSKIPVCFGMLIFYFTFYCTSLNIMRQCIAIAILFYGFTFLIDKHYIRYIITTLVAALFHTAALLGFAILLIYIYSTSDRVANVKIRLGQRELGSNAFRIITFGIICVIAVLLIGVIGQLFDLLGLGRYYSVYLSGDLTLMLNQIVRRIPWILLLLYSWKSLQKQSNLAVFFVNILISDIVLSQLNSLFEQSGRLTMFFSIFYIIMVPMACKSIPKTNNRRIVTALCVLYMVALWYYDFVYQGSSEVIPYLFFFS